MDKRSESGAVRLEIVDATSDYGAGALRGPAVGRPARRGFSPLPGPRSGRVAPPSPGYLFLKRMFDVVVSLALLAVSFPILLVIMLWISVESPGPALYRRRVLALQDWDGRPESLRTFDAFKLRTMITNAEEFLLKNPHLFSQYQKDWKLEHDPRVTRLGAFLRSSSIDELPQLLNVLRGEMSLIGPRMITVPELERYGADGARLLSVKPGLTGLWQVSGRQEVSYEDRIRLDMLYVEARSPALDFRIFLKTIRCVLLRQGAY